ncbi:MAG TPA: HEPN domain-containing protein [Sedimentisphaerales bacterium]|nr:HEPN domain-containing protein [Sedimentisphaerales bacterium]
MNDEYLQKWLLRADNDLKVAEHEMAAPKDELVTEAVCFHCQQAVEKYLKACLVRHNVDFGKTHNLEYLVELCSKEDIEFRALEVGNLTFYAVEVRYPDAFYTPSVEEARESIEIAKRVRKFVIKKIEE